MRKWWPGIKHLDAIIVCVGWMVLFLLSMYFNLSEIIVFAIAIAPVLILLWYFVFKPQIFLFVTIFFVPLSVALDLSGGATLFFPSELMAVLLLGYLVLNFNRIRIPDRRIFRHPIFILLIIYIAWMIVASALSVLPVISFKHTIIQILYIAVFYFLFLIRFDEPANIIRFFLFYALGMIVPIANGMVWHSQYNFIQQASYYMPQPFFIEHTIYGATIAFLIPMLIYLVITRNEFTVTPLRKLGILLLLVILIVAEFLSYSRAAWFSLLSLPFMLVIIRLKIRQGYLLAGIVAILVVIIINIDPIIEYIDRNDSSSNRGNLKEQFQSVSNIHSDMSNLERINRWKCVLRMYEEKPLQGFGPGTYQFLYGSYQVKSEMTRISTYQGDKGNAHSEYLGFLADSGIPGFIIYLVLVITVISTALKVIYYGDDKKIRNLATVVLLCVMTFFAHSIFNGFIETVKIGSLLFGSIAAITALDVYYKKGATS